MREEDAVHKRIIVAFFAACGAAVLGSLVVSAEVGEADACRSACQEQKARCVTECGAHPDPVECEADCRDALYDCQRECR